VVEVEQMIVILQVLVVLEVEDIEINQLEQQEIPLL
jgi:hypothetical protein